MCDLYNYTIAWWHMPPFVAAAQDKNGEYVRGIMLSAISTASQMCCKYGKTLQLNKPFELQQYEGQEQMLNNVTHESTLALPVIIPSAVAAMKPSEYFVRMVDSSGMVHVGKLGEPLTHVLIEALMAIWPLLAALLILTGYSALILWLMATVGYGDKVPSGVVSKCFTMFWAVLGISVMAGTTATLTTLLAEHQQSVSKLQPIKGQKVAVMTGSVERRFVTQLGGIPVEYQNFEEMRRALLNDSIDHMAIDHYSFHHYFNSSMLANFKYEVVETPEVTIGYILFLPHQRDFIECLRLRSFLSELSVDSQLIRNIVHDRDLDSSDPASAMQSAAKSIFSGGLKFTLMLLGIVCLSITVFIAVCLLVSQSKCRRQQRCAAGKDCIEEKDEKQNDKLLYPVTNDAAITMPST